MTETTGTTVGRSTATATGAAMELPLTRQAATTTIVVEETASTNTLARQLLADGRLHVRPGEVAVVAAKRQTAGRGRLDHTWMSRPGESSTISYVVAVPRALAVDPSVNGWIQMVGGLAALDGLTGAVADAGGAWRDGIRPMLKWPNDVFLDGRKLGGILCELATTPVEGGAAETAVIIVGIGLNLRVPADRLPDGATSLHLHVDGLADASGRMGGGGPAHGGDSTDGGSRSLEDAIAAGVVRSLRDRLSRLGTDPATQAASLREETEAVCWTLGRRAVAHYMDGSELEGTAVSLNADASLTMRADDGQLRVVRTADVGVLPERS